MFTAICIFVILSAIGSCSTTNVDPPTHFIPEGGGWTWDDSMNRWERGGSGDLEKYEFISGKWVYFPTWNSQHPTTWN